MLKTLNAKAQRRKDARVLPALSASRGPHRAVRSGGQPLPFRTRAVRFASLPLCDFALNSALNRVQRSVVRNLPSGPRTPSSIPGPTRRVQRHAYARNLPQAGTPSNPSFAHSGNPLSPCEARAGREPERGAAKTAHPHSTPLTRSAPISADQRFIPSPRFASLPLCDFALNCPTATRQPLPGRPRACTPSAIHPARSI